MKGGAGDGARLKRAMLTGNRATSQEVRGPNLYVSDYAVLPPLLVGEGKRLPRILWEPHCGTGALVRPLRNRGFTVAASDLNDYGLPESEPFVDFLGPAAIRFRTYGVPAVLRPWGIIANPPFDDVEAHVDRAMQFASYAAFFLRFSFLEGIGRMRWWSKVGLRRVHLIADRLPMMHGEHVPLEDRTMKDAGMAFAWFIFERGKRPSRAYTVRPISWKESARRWPKAVDGSDDPVTAKALPTLFDLRLP